MKLYYLFVAALLISCGRQKSLQEISKADHFKTFIKKMRIQDLPLTYDLNQGPSATTYFIDSKSVDTLFIEGGTIGGILPDTSTFYCVLYYQTGDLIYPFISTFDKQGNLIDSGNIGIGLCGGHIGDLDTCIDRVTINRQLEIESFYMASGIAEDTTDQEVKFCNSVTGKGQIKKDGKIEFVKTEMDCLQAEH